MKKRTSAWRVVASSSWLSGLLLLASISHAAPQAAEISAQSVKDLLARTRFTFDGETVTYKEGITAGRYMEQDITGGCTDVSVPAWEGFPLRSCTYRQRDKKAPGGFKKATVVMLNPDRELLAKWILASCMRVLGGPASDSCVNKLANAVIVASGSQFAVIGMVLEDMKSTGVQGAYIFRDGVTVRVDGGVPVGYTGALNSNDIAVALDPSRPLLGTASDRAPARIQNTTRAMYAAYGHIAPDALAGVRWLEVVRTQYQDAWKRGHDPELREDTDKYRNDLMIARCYALLGRKPPP